MGTGGWFKTPSLLGVGARGRWMHDGCAETLRERFDEDSCGGHQHGDTSALTDDDLTHMIAFLETL